MSGISDIDGSMEDVIRREQGNLELTLMLSHWVSVEGTSNNINHNFGPWKPYSPSIMHAP